MAGDLKISVITPCLNARKYIQQAIDSVQSQSYQNWEHVVVDGGSSDGTVDILEQTPGLVWLSEPDDGQSNAMNKGFELSSGDVIVYLNADDYFVPDAFDRAIAEFKRGAEFVVGDVIVEEPDGGRKIVSPRNTLQDMLRHWESWVLQDGKYTSPFPNNPVQYFYTRRVQQKVPFNENNRSTMDLEFLLRAAKISSLTKIDHVLGVYRIVPEAVNMVSRNAFADYWIPENFSYIDDVISDWDLPDILAYKNEQMVAYSQQIKHGVRAMAQGMDTAMVDYYHRSRLNPVAKFKALLVLVDEVCRYLVDLEKLQSPRN